MSAALVLGGVDVTGPHLYNIYPHGSSDKLPYLTMGSGSLAAMSVSVRAEARTYRVSLCTGDAADHAKGPYNIALDGTAQMALLYLALQTS